MIPGTVRIYVCIVPQDMRCGFDGLARAVTDVLGKDPQSGAMYCFVNRRANRLKVLWWDSNGYCILYKRVHDAMFELPGPPRGETAIKIDAKKLAKLIAGAKREGRRKRS